MSADRAPHFAFCQSTIIPCFAKEWRHFWAVNRTSPWLLRPPTAARQSNQFRKHRPDVTLMDLQMPEMNGVDAMIAICGEFAGARIIVLTTYTGDVQVCARSKPALRAYLLKGLLRKELLETIRLVHAGRNGCHPRSPRNLPSMPPMMPCPYEKLRSEADFGRECQ